MISRYFPPLMISLALLLAGCTARDRMLFDDGLSAMSGKGGETARADALPATRQLARELAPQQPRPVWQGPFPQEAADIAVFVDDRKLLVGTAASSAYLGIPDYSELILYDTSTGAQLWRSARPDLDKGQYRVISLSPHIVLAGKTDDTLVLLAYDVGNGKRLWKKEIDRGLRAIHHGSTLVVSSFDDDTWAIYALDVTTGQQSWKQQVATDIENDRAYNMMVRGQSLFLVSRELHALSTTDGRDLWKATPPRPDALILDVLAFDDDYLIVDTGGVTRFDTQLKKPEWRHKVSSSSVHVASFDQANMYVLSETGKPGRSGTSIIEALDLKQGQPVWRYSLSDKVTSPLLHTDGRIIFSDSEHLTALNQKTGKKLFRRKLSNDLVKASPLAASYQGQPDLLKVQGNNIILARELYGVAAYNIKNGRPVWRQMHYITGESNPYTINHQVNVLEQTLKLYGFKPPENTAGNSLPATQYQNSLTLQTLQTSADNARASANLSLSSRDRTRLGTQIARVSKVQSIESSMIAERMRQNRQAMQAITDFMWAGFDFAEALGEALKQQAYQGLIERLTLKMNSTIRARQSAFQGDYYIWPFQERGRGLTIVNLNTGRRNDLMFAPMVPPLTDYGLDLVTYTIQPEDHRLITFGVPIHVKEYDDYVKWKWRLPRAEALAYNLNTLEYRKKSTTQDYWQQNLKTDLVEWAFRGDLSQVRKLIARGVDVNQEKYTITPLWAAISRGHTRVVRELLNSGANPNWQHTMMQLQPLEMARNIKASDEIINLLLQAGATELQ